jgi:hypothetical protein
MKWSKGAALQHSDGLGNEQVDKLCTQKQKIEEAKVNEWSKPAIFRREDHLQQGLTSFITKNDSEDQKTAQKDPQPQRHCCANSSNDDEPL